MTKDKQGNPLHLLKHELGPIEDVSCTLDAEGHCITCSDEKWLAQVTLDGRVEEIDISLVESIAPGDIVLVHGGVAIERVDEATNA